jgi:hypothetical protein
MLESLGEYRTEYAFPRKRLKFIITVCSRQLKAIKNRLSSLKNGRLTLLSVGKKLGTLQARMLMRADPSLRHLADQIRSFLAIKH